MSASNTVTDIGTQFQQRLGDADEVLTEQNLRAPVLLWVIKNRHSKKFAKLLNDLITPRLLSAIFFAIDYEALQASSARRIPLGDILSEDTDLISDLLSTADGSLRRLAARSPGTMTRVQGLGAVRALAIHAALELGRRMAAEAVDLAEPLRSARDVWRTYAPRLEDLTVEEFHVAILDAQHRLDRDVLVTRGILNSSLVHAREVFREAIAERAAAISAWLAVCRMPATWPSSRVGSLVF